MIRFSLVFLFFFSLRSFADDNSAFFDSLPKYRLSLVSKCRIDDETHALIFTGNTKTAYYVEMASDGFVVQMARINFNGGGYVVEDAHGGVSSFQMVRNQVEKLLGESFFVKETKKLEKFIKSRRGSENQCAS